MNLKVISRNVGFALLASAFFMFLSICLVFALVCSCFFFFFQAEGGIRDFCLSRGLGDVY